MSIDAVRSKKEDQYQNIIFLAIQDLMNKYKKGSIKINDSHTINLIIEQDKKEMTILSGMQLGKYDVYTVGLDGDYEDINYNGLLNIIENLIK